MNHLRNNKIKKKPDIIIIFGIRQNSSKLERIISLFIFYSLILLYIIHFFFIQVAFMQWRINGQYIMEGLASSFLFTLGAVGFILLDMTNEKERMPKLNRVILLSIGAISVLVSFFTLRVFMRIKMP